MIQPKILKIPKLFSGNFQFKDGVVKYPADVLREVAKDVTDPSEAREIIGQMIDTVSKFMSGAGLAAPQIGIAKRVICIRRNNEFIPIVNPVISEAYGMATSFEGCLSTPNLWGYVERNTEVVVNGLNINFEPYTESFFNFEAFVVQHEIDHLNGIMFFDRADPKSLKWKSSVLGVSKSATFESLDG